MTTTTTRSKKGFKETNPVAQMVLDSLTSGEKRSLLYIIEHHSKDLHDIGRYIEAASEYSNTLTEALTAMSDELIEMRNDIAELKKQVDSKTKYGG